MRVTIDIEVRDAQVLSKWASVSRTINLAIQLLERPDPDPDDATHCILALKAIEPALNRLHQLAREEIWKREGRS
jgi:hypothetical protein